MRRQRRPALDHIGGANGQAKSARSPKACVVGGVANGGYLLCGQLTAYGSQHRCAFVGRNPRQVQVD